LLPGDILEHAKSVKMVIDQRSTRIKSPIPIPKILGPSRKSSSAIFHIRIEASREL